MPAFLKIVATSLAVMTLGTALVAAPALAESNPTATTSSITPPTERQLNSAIDALRDVLDAMVDRGAMTPDEREAVVTAVRAAGWDGYSIERLGDILAVVVKKGVISTNQRDVVLDGVRHSRRAILRLAVVLDTLTPAVLSRVQHDAIVDALHRADWDGLSIERLGDILQALVNRGVISRLQRATILDGMRW